MLPRSTHTQANGRNHHSDHRHSKAHRRHRSLTTATVFPILRSTTHLCWCGSKLLGNTGIGLRIWSWRGCNRNKRHVCILVYQYLLSPCFTSFPNKYCIQYTNITCLRSCICWPLWLVSFWTVFGVRFGLFYVLYRRRTLNLSFYFLIIQTHPIFRSARFYGSDVPLVS